MLNSTNFSTIGLEQPNKTFDITLENHGSHDLPMYEVVWCSNLSKFSQISNKILSFKIPQEIKGEVNFAKRNENDDFGFIKINCINDDVGPSGIVATHADEVKRNRRFSRSDLEPIQTLENIDPPYRVKEQELVSCIALGEPKNFFMNINVVYAGRYSINSQRKRTETHGEQKNILCLNVNNKFIEVPQIDIREPNKEEIEFVKEQIKKSNP